MIAVDTSAIVAILLGEPEQFRFITVLDENAHCVMSAATLVGLNLVMFRRLKTDGHEMVRKIIETSAIDIWPLTAYQADIGRSAKIHFPILNFGDCFSYALAKDLDIPLLFKGNDFSQTDLRPV